jgi:hypothetical protein
MIPVNVDELVLERPNLFANAIPPIEDRRNIKLGERVKVLVGIREDEKLAKGRWVIVEACQNEQARSCFVGRSDSSVGYNDDVCIEFQPEHVYRIEPRIFTLWGEKGVPRARRSQASNDAGFHAPIDREENLLSDCSEPILRFKANGYSDAMSHFEVLAIQNPTWPSWDDLE